MCNKIKKNLANIITASRFFVAAAILLLYFTNAENWLWRCLALFVLGGLTDVVDGFVARKFNNVSNLGKLLDPLCDKAMMLAMILVLVLGGYIYMWIFIALAAKELLMILGSVFFVNKKIVVKSNWYGKSATALLTAAVIMAVLGWKPYSDYVLFAGIVWTFVAMIQYGILYYKEFKNS